MRADTGTLYDILKKEYGPRGWWPIVSLETGISSYGTLKKPGYDEIFEIIIGSILTQGVAWSNVEKAIFNLKKAGLLQPQKMKKAELNEIALQIKPSGYFNQKAIKIKNFINWFETWNFSFEKLAALKTDSVRAELLSVKGIGPETADSILLYAFSRRIFVIDAYTKRIFSRIGLIEAEASYNDVQELFHATFRGRTSSYNEYHALIVEHGKSICRTKPHCDKCCIRSYCSYKQT